MHLMPKSSFGNVCKMRMLRGDKGTCKGKSLSFGKAKMVIIGGIAQECDALFMPFKSFLTSFYYGVFRELHGLILPASLFC